MLLWIWLVKGARFICRRKDEGGKRIRGEREKSMETEKQWTVIEIINDEAI